MCDEYLPLLHTSEITNMNNEHKFQAQKLIETNPYVSLTFGKCDVF